MGLNSLSRIFFYAFFKGFSWLGLTQPVNHHAYDEGTLIWHQIHIHDHEFTNVIAMNNPSFLHERDQGTTTPNYCNSKHIKISKMDPQNSFKNPQTKSDNYCTKLKMLIQNQWNHQIFKRRSLAKDVDWSRQLYAISFQLYEQLLINYLNS